MKKYYIRNKFVLCLICLVLPCLFGCGESNSSRIKNSDNNSVIKKLSSFTSLSKFDDTLFDFVYINENEGWVVRVGKENNHIRIADVEIVNILCGFNNMSAEEAMNGRCEFIYNLTEKKYIVYFEEDIFGISSVIIDADKEEILVNMDGENLNASDEFTEYIKNCKIIESMKLDVESVESTLGGNGISIEDIEKLKLADVKKLYEDNSNEKQKYEDFLEFMKNQNHIIYHIGETAKCGDWSIYIKFVDVCPNTFSGMDINVHCLVSNTSSDKLTYYAPSMYSLLNNGLGIDASPSDVDGYTIESGTQLDTVITFNYPSACLDNLKQMTLICEETEISFYPKTQTKEEFDDFEGVYESYSEYDGHINSMFTVNKISENNYEIYWVCGGQNASDFFSWMGETNASLYDKNEYQAFKLGNTFYYFVSEENRIYDVTNIGEIERSRYWIKVNPTFSDESDWEDTGDISSDNTIEDDGTGIVNDEQTDEYILYDSDKRYIDKSELDIMDKTMLRVARNEIYARHGRIFDSQELKQYFESCSWYKGTISSSEFDESVLNEYEKANAKLISDVENLK